MRAGLRARPGPSRPPGFGQDPRPRPNPKHAQLRAGLNPLRPGRLRALHLPGIPCAPHPQPRTSPDPWLGMETARRQTVTWAAEGRGGSGAASPPHPQAHPRADSSLGSAGSPPLRQAPGRDDPTTCSSAPKPRGAVANSLGASLAPASFPGGRDLRGGSPSAPSLLQQVKGLATPTPPSAPGRVREPRPRPPPRRPLSGPAAPPSPGSPAQVRAGRAQPALPT